MACVCEVTRVSGVGGGASPCHDSVIIAVATRTHHRCVCALSAALEIVSMSLRRARMQVSAVVRAMAIPELKAMLASGTETAGGVSNAISTLCVICAAPEGRDAAVAAGVPAAVTAAMATCNAIARSNAACLLSNM